MSIHLKYYFMINNYHYILHFILWIFLFRNKAYSLGVIIRNTEEDISSIPTILHNIPLYKDGLIYIFQIHITILVRMIYGQFQLQWNILYHLLVLQKIIQFSITGIIFLNIFIYQ